MRGRYLVSCRVRMSPNYYGMDNLLRELPPPKGGLQRPPGMGCASSAIRHLRVSTSALVFFLGKQGSLWVCPAEACVAWPSALTRLPEQQVAPSGLRAAVPSVWVLAQPPGFDSWLRRLRRVAFSSLQLPCWEKGLGWPPEGKDICFASPC